MEALSLKVFTSRLLRWLWALVVGKSTGLSQRGCVLGLWGPRPVWGPSGSAKGETCTPKLASLFWTGHEGFLEEELL